MSRAMTKNDNIIKHLFAHHGIENSDLNKRALTSFVEQSNRDSVPILPVIKMIKKVKDANSSFDSYSP